MACLKCGSEATVDGVRVLDRAHLPLALDLQVVVEREPDATFFKNPAESGVSVRACGDCGFLEMYARNPGSLLKAAKSRAAKRKK